MVACENGTRFDHDFNAVAVEAICLEEDVWKVPEPWPSCVESKRTKALYGILSEEQTISFHFKGLNFLRQYCIHFISLQPSIVPMLQLHQKRSL